MHHAETIRGISDFHPEEFNRLHKYKNNPKRDKTYLYECHIGSFKGCIKTLVICIEFQNHDKKDNKMRQNIKK